MTVLASATDRTEKPSGPALLSCHDLEIRLGGRSVLHDVDVEIHEGQIHVLLGPNGAGKTTLLRALLGQLRPAAGSVHEDGRLGYVSQRQDMDWEFPVTAEDVVMLGLVRRISRFRGPRRQHYTAVAKALQRVRMQDLRERPISEMSGGQRQRVMIARALVLDPTVLLLDEPFTGLDMPSQELLTGLFRELARDGCSILMSTHDLAHALSIANGVTLLNRTVIAEGAPHDLRSPKVWQKTFEVTHNSPLLRQVSALLPEDPD